MSLALLSLCLLCARPAHAQGGYPGGGWSVTDKDGNPLSPNQDGSGYPLSGAMTGTPPDLTGAYPDVFAAASLPSPTINYAFTPNLWSDQYWLYTGDPCPTGASVWTTASASNNVSTRGGGVMGYLSDYGNANVVGSLDPSTGGTLWAIFTAPQGQTVPDHIDVLLTTTVQASASVNPTPSIYLSATGTATDSLNETAQASADGSGGGVPLVTGRHLLRVPVDARTSEAQVSLGGTTTATATDNVPYGAFSTPPYGGYYSMTNGPTNAVATASISAAARIDSREVTISSPTIEDSYQKTNNPETFGSDIHVRDLSSGVMSVESVVTLFNGDFVVGRGAIGDAFVANTPGFQYPYYTWSLPTPGGTVDQYTQQYLGVESDQYEDIAVHIDFGASKTVFPTKSVVRVDVRDSDNATGSNIYNVTWHLPVENWAALGALASGPNRIFPEPGKDSSGNTNMQVNETVDVTLHTKEDDLDYGPGLKLLSVFLGGASPFLPAAIDGPWGLALSGLAGAASVTAGFLIPADPAQDHTPNGGTFYAEYVGDVGIQKQINDNNAAGYPDNSTPHFIPSDTKSVDAAVAAIVTAQGHYDQDPIFNSGHMWATEFTGYSTTFQNYQGDAYDTHGYAGNANGTDRKDKTLFYVFIWHRGTP